jgi:hypothetical protein
MRRRHRGRSGGRDHEEQQHARRDRPDRRAARRRDGRDDATVSVPLMLVSRERRRVGGEEKVRHGLHGLHGLHGRHLGHEGQGGAAGRAAALTEQRCQREGEHPALRGGRREVVQGQRRQARAVRDVQHAQEPPHCCLFPSSCHALPTLPDSASAVAQRDQPDPRDQRDQHQHDQPDCMSVTDAARERERSRVCAARGRGAPARHAAFDIAAQKSACPAPGTVFRLPMNTTV